MREREKAHRPLMFIHQPTEHLPQTMMQYVYSSLRDETPYPKIESEEQSSATKVQTKDDTENDSTQIDQSDKRVEKQWKEKRFADLTIQEKIDYCISTSPHIPNIICAIKTKTTTTVGMIRSSEGGIVHVTSKNNRVTKQILIEEIINIRMIGF